MTGKYGMWSKVTAMQCSNAKGQGSSGARASVRLVKVPGVPALPPLIDATVVRRQTQERNENRNLCPKAGLPRVTPLVGKLMKQPPQGELEGTLA